MTLRNSLALNVSPLLIRLGLGAVFLWAGAGKVFYSDPYSGERAAILANLGLLPTTRPPQSADASPAQPSSETTTPSESPPAAPAPASGPARYTAEDFPEPIEAARVYATAIILYQAGNLEGGAQRLWPSALSTPGAMKVISWSAALAEFLGGAFVLLGFLTRLSALALAAYRAFSLALTVIGPAVVSGQAFIGFLPAHQLSDPTGWVLAWTPLMFQSVVLLMALAVFLSGPGALSLDRILFTRPGGKRADAPAKPA